VYHLSGGVVSGLKSTLTSNKCDIVGKPPLVCFRKAYFASAVNCVVNKYNLRL
jgi:hypothetical protein